MKVRISAVALFLGLSTAAGATGGYAVAAPVKATCQQGGYSTAAAKCVTVPPSGSYSIKVPGAGTVLVGQGSSSTAGTQIHVIKVTNPSSTGVAIRLTASGPFGPLKLKKGKLLLFNP